eukprot:scaffold11203_cov32-Tisochrysis_lutea.AAC.2
MCAGSLGTSGSRARLPVGAPSERVLRSAALERLADCGIRIEDADACCSLDPARSFSTLTFSLLPVSSKSGRADKSDSSFATEDLEPSFEEEECGWVLRMECWSKRHEIK